jgi:hypothetical protein
MPSLTRRRALEAAVTGSLAALAGCASDALGCDPRTELRLDPVDDAAVAAENDRTPADLHPLGTDLVRAAGTDGTATYHGARWIPPDADLAPFPIGRGGPLDPPDHRYLRVDGRYYRIVIERAREATTTVQAFVLRTNPTVNADAQGGDTVAVADLPRHDRRAVLAALGDHAGSDQDDFDQFAQVWELGYLQDGLAESSLLVPDPAHRYVGYRDWFLELEPNGTEDGKRVDYDVSLSHLADDEAGFAAAVRERDGLALDRSDLPADQRDVLDEAADGTYAECGEWSPALESVAERLAGVRYARYDGQWYATNTGDWFARR